jgi:hypothetical protein
MNWSKGPVAKSRHWPSGAMVARAEAGRSQYGPRNHSPRLWKPKMPWVYQKKPRMVVKMTAAAAHSSRLRSSCRWSTSDMVPSGFTRARRCRGSNFLKIAGGTGSPQDTG